ncbi:MAG: glycosyltransferase family 4 protein [Gemmatimonadetes bacterium]|nr:glycosyltransferase family 4 protein [Gemmatimonadota bacterium]
MHVLHVHSGNLYGGVETLLLTLAREGEHVPGMVQSFALCFDGRLRDELLEAGASVHPLRPVRLSRPHTVYRARKALSTLLRVESFDVVVCHQPWPLVIFGPVARAAGLPLVLWVHMAQDGRHWLDRLARRRAPDLAIVNSRFTEQRLATWWRDLKTACLYYPFSAPPVVTEAIRVAVRRSLDTPADATVIVQVSRLEPWKGQRVAVEALGRLSEVPGWMLWIAGGAQRAAEARFRRELEQRVAALNLTPRVRFLGERRDVPAVLAAADIFCQPNTAPEPFGLSALEALAAGLPVVCSNEGGVAEIVDSSCGVQAPPGDVGALASALRTLLDDPALRSRLAGGARRRPAALCDPGRQMRSLETILSSLPARASRLEAAG